MSRDKSEIVPAEIAAPAAVVLYLSRPWTTGAGVTYPAHVEGAKPLTLDFAALPDGVTTADIDYLISTGSAESAAMRDARLKAARAPAPA